MNTKIISINDVLSQLRLFSKDVIEWFPPVELSQVIRFEEKLKTKLPQDFVDFLKVSNGLSLLGFEIIGFSNNKIRYGLEEVYTFEHSEVDSFMPSSFIPFSPDGFGNHYCIDIKKNVIVFWEHDCDYSDTTPQLISNSFSEFMQNKVINEILKDYDYLGNEKH